MAGQGEALGLTGMTMRRPGLRRGHGRPSGWMVELGLQILESRLTSYSPLLAWPLLLKCLWNPSLCSLTLSALSLNLCLSGLSLCRDPSVLPLGGSLYPDLPLPYLPLSSHPPNGLEPKGHLSVLVSWSLCLPPLLCFTQFELTLWSPSPLLKLLCQWSPVTTCHGCFLEVVICPVPPSCSRGMSHRVIYPRTLCLP